MLQDIPAEEELLVWYGQNSVYHMGLPLTSHNTGEGMQFLYCKGCSEIIETFILIPLEKYINA